MNAQINVELFRQINFDSGSLGVLASICHKFSTPGLYDGSVMRAGISVAEFELIVDARVQQTQVNIDLQSLLPSTVQSGSPSSSRTIFQVKPEGYAVFYVSRGSGGFSILIRERRNGEPTDDQSNKADAVEDSKSKIVSNEQMWFLIARYYRRGYVVITMLQPGRHSLRNAVNGATGTIRVGYPDRQRMNPFPPPVPIRCQQDMFNPNDFTVEPTQGQIYQIETPSRIKIEQVEAVSSPGPASPRGVRLTRPPVDEKNEDKTTG